MYINIEVKIKLKDQAITITRSSSFYIFRVLVKK